LIREESIRDDIFAARAEGVDVGRGRHVEFVDFSSDSPRTRLPKVFRAVVELARPDWRRSMERSVSTYQDAQLILKLYELRRDEKLRAAREWFVQRFFPTKVEDVQAVTGSAGSDNISFRMVTSYWEMAASFVARGILNADLFLDSSGEMLFVWAKVEPFLSHLRQTMNNPTFLKSMQTVVESSPRAKERIVAVRQRVNQMRERHAAGGGKP
jgi:hypothetical protein